ncbi:class II D-tagatose-bisphosphate aldolase non-catalytic subunit, partial [Serratia sp. (in: enterobacteria)]|uniref:class II D-tagatose-bisphosphate aldolase non-catalytic subunit n=1 Tax=Serratia sp. (in: enterobacteria) TaxID=616 RepID=UPI003988DFA7
PAGLLSQYFPLQYQRVMERKLAKQPHALMIDKIQDVLRAYRFGCTPAEQAKNTEEMAHA